MGPYLVFAFLHYDPKGGAGDFVDSFSNLENAEGFVRGWGDFGDRNVLQVVRAREGRLDIISVWDSVKDPRADDWFWVKRKQETAMHDDRDLEVITKEQVGSLPVQSQGSPPDYVSPPAAGVAKTEAGIGFRPRDDFVVLRIVQGGLSKGGVALPDSSVTGKLWRVVGVGPKVTDLEVGDEVEMVGQANVDILKLPRTNDRDELFVTRDRNVILVFDRRA